MKEVTFLLSAPDAKKTARIISLTKEVEILKNDLMDALDLKNGNGPTALTMLSNELTRLRELLDRAKAALEMTGIKWAPIPQLLSEINALNHKP